VDGNASHNASRRAIASFKGAKCGICGTVALAAIKEDGTALGVMKLRAPMREGRSIGLITALYQDDEIERLEEEKEAVGVVVDLEGAGAYVGGREGWRGACPASMFGSSMMPIF